MFSFLFKLSLPKAAFSKREKMLNAKDTVLGVLPPSQEKLKEKNKIIYVYMNGSYNNAEMMDMYVMCI